jgi:hypothetical protein
MPKGKDCNVKRSDEIQSEIQELEQELVPLNLELEGHIRKFATESLPSPAATWMSKEVKSQVEANATRIDEIGVEKLKALKVELAELTEQIPQFALRAIEDQQKWPHLEKYHAHTPTYSNPRTSYFDDVFRAVINKLGALLAKYDLIKVPSSRTTEWEKDRSGGYRYVFNPGFDERDFPVVQEYNAARKTQRQKAVDLAKKREELVKAKAAELWDSV